MAITPTSRICAKAIQTYQICSLQRAERSSQSRNPAEQNIRNKSDTVQFSQEALDRLELLKKSRAKDIPKETQTIQEKDSELEKNLKILALDKDASVEEIRKAYLHAIQQYHPDKHACLPPEFRQLAEAKSKQINELYHAVLKLKTGARR
ncbi:MAG: DnaJ domain-containing protein [Syntrophobacter sp.]